MPSRSSFPKAVRQIRQTFPRLPTQRRRAAPGLSVRLCGCAKAALCSVASLVVGQSLLEFLPFGFLLGEPRHGICQTISETPQAAWKVLAEREEHGNPTLISDACWLLIHLVKAPTNHRDMCFTPYLLRLSCLITVV